MEKEALYWGLVRPRLPWVKDWILIHEAHDVAGLDPQASLEANPFELQSGAEGRRRQRLMKALHNYDLILCVSQALANDLMRWSDGSLRPHVVRHASALPRLPHPPRLDLLATR